MPQLLSDRLEFRLWQRDHLAFAEALWRDPEVTRFIGGPMDAADRLAREIASQDAHGIQYWPIFLRADGAFVGCCGLRPYRPQVPELGAHILPAFWRRGLALEACRAVIDHAFAALGAESIFAGHNPANDASRAMLARLGFRHTHDELYPPTGLLHPSYRLDRAP